MSHVNKICVVGNKLSCFSNNQNVFTAKRFFDLLKIEKKISHGSNSYEVHVGQGLGEKLLKKIYRDVNENEISNRFLLKGALDGRVRADNTLTHKEKSKNTMISSPEKINDEKFHAFLMLDEDCAEMSDHLTGQHIQGMVLIEAARQMINAVSERFLISEEQKGQINFVLNGVESVFYEYIFPLEVEIDCKIIKIRRVKGGSFNANVEVNFLQNSKKMMSILFDYGVTDKKYLSQKESAMAKNAINGIFNFFDHVDVRKEAA